MLSLAVTGLALSSVYANIAELRTNARALSLAIAGLQTRYGRRRRRRSFDFTDLDDLLSEGNPSSVQKKKGLNKNYFCNFLFR